MKQNGAVGMHTHACAIYVTTVYHCQDTLMIVFSLLKMLNFISMLELLLEISSSALILNAC